MLGWERLALEEAVRRLVDTMVAARRVLKRLIRKEIGGGKGNETMVCFVEERAGGVVVEMLKMRAIFLLER
jgi:hypothetical protein